MTQSTADLAASGASWMHLLRERAIARAADDAYTFLTDGEEQEQHLAVGELDRQARAIAAQLQSLNAAGGRAILLFPPGLEFISALFGCWYAGITAVPAYPPRSAQHGAALGVLRSIAQDAEPCAVLTLARMRPTLHAVRGELPFLDTACVIAIDEIPEQSDHNWQMPQVTGQTLAALQYTSGSTAAPKGVMLTHSNLLHGSAVIRECFGHTTASRGVIWLPPYHDMGLIGGILQPLYAGFSVVLMAPAAFLQRPLRWLKAISKYHGTTSGGPNFAFELCVKQIRDEDKKSLDLSSWQVAFNGAEPIDAQTLDRFCEAFSQCGFRREAFYPCYGLAESTLLVSGGERTAKPITHVSDSKTYVGCGRARPAGSVRIVNPEMREICSPGNVGEIWVRSAAVGSGYWKKPVETQEAFDARIAGTAEGPFLRTGDLGFIDGDELYITGRLKDLIIIRGRNHYPQDIELTAQASHPALRPGSGAAFSVNGDGPERLVIVHEVERTHRNVDPQSIIDAVCLRVAEEHELQTSAIVLLKPGQILKTSSGKIRRSACRAAFLDSTLDPLAIWKAPVGSAAAASGAAGPSAGKLSLEQIEDVIVAKLANAISAKADEIDPAEPFARYGLDSAGAATLSGELEPLVGCDLPLTLFYDYPSPRDLARHLAGEAAIAPVAAH